MAGVNVNVDSIVNGSLSSLFTPTWGNSSTGGYYVATTASTPTIYRSDGNYDGWSAPSMTAAKAKQDPLDWLRGEIERYTDLGTLHD